MTTSTPIPPRPPRPFLTAPPQETTPSPPPHCHSHRPHPDPSRSPPSISPSPPIPHTSAIQPARTPLTTSPDQLRPNVRHAPPRSSIPLPQINTRKE
ncbi:proline-rich receptor-like protein kinase PERK2 [Iris pallida]|uniref:Proline-rich receptor-like protein kinase PERK2 n=1 Tax=Iris pallida TaxID=29817 RepID=A0AAX6IPC1_IRIPA|nr:proline-rich receptor-like protein kinase PERK2 [Iris pallida]